MYITEESKQLLNHAEYPVAYSHFLDLKAQMPSVENEYQKDILSYLRNDGLFLYKPDCISWGESLILRYDKLSTLNMILYDYDGCETAKQIRSLIKETLDAVLRCVFCVPDVLYSGGGNEETLSDFAQKFGLMGYDLPNLEYGHCAFVAIPEQYYVNNCVDKHGLISRLALHDLQNQDYWWLVTDYKHHLFNEQKDNRFDSTENEHSFCGFETSLYERQGIRWHPAHIEKAADDIARSIQEHFMCLAAHLIEFCVSALEHDTGDVDFWKQKVDHIIDYTTNSLRVMRTMSCE